MTNDKSIVNNKNKDDKKQKPNKYEVSKLQARPINIHGFHGK